MNNTTLLLEYKINCILHILQDIKGVRVNSFGDPKNVCAVCYKTVEYFPDINGQIQRKCECTLPVDSIDMSVYKKEV